MEYLLTGHEMASCDTRTSQIIGIPSLVLMERAALSVADGAQACLESGRKSGYVLAAAGRGNNGADALAAGRILLERGYDVRFCRLSGDISPDSSFAVQEKILRSFGKTVSVYPDETAFLGIEPPAVILDGLFGTGLSRELQGDAARMVMDLNRLRDRCGSYVIGVDIPSGISSDDGRVMGCAVRCDETRTFAFYKRGHWMFPGASYAGRCHLAQIGITVRAMERLPEMFTLQTERPSDLLPHRSEAGNKGTFGKVLIMAGRRNMCGAALLAARSCMACGAGMVRIFTHDENRVIVQQALPEALLETWTGTEPEEAVRNKLLASVRWADIVAAGPAMGTDAKAGMLLGTLLEAVCEDPAHASGVRGLVLDADALRILADSPDLCGLLAGRPAKIPCVLTPHLAEFAALAGKSVTACREDLVRNVRGQADRLQCTVICKDARTLAAKPSGKGETAEDMTDPPSGLPGLFLNILGNDGMATAGSGDVLTGMCAAMLAQFTSADARDASALHAGAGGPFASAGSADFKAACCAVYSHAAAGDRAASMYGKPGMTAGDLIEALRSPDFF